MELRLLRYFVAVADERHFGRAAAGLHLAQPSLSRAIRQLEDDLGVRVFDRTSTGVALTPAGTALYGEARAILDRVEHARSRVLATAAGEARLVVGTLSDAVEETGPQLAATFRSRHPGVAVSVREADFTDPSAGLRAGLVDVAITRTPFDLTGISTHVLRSDPVGVVLRADDPLAARAEIGLADLAGRSWFRFPDGTDPAWTAYWTAGGRGGRDAVVVRTVHECLQTVRWNGTVGLAPMVHEPPDGLVTVPITDQPPSRLVAAWLGHDPGPLVQTFVTVVAAQYRTAQYRTAQYRTAGERVADRTAGRRRGPAPRG